MKVFTYEDKRYAPAGQGASDSQALPIVAIYQHNLNRAFRADAGTAASLQRASLGRAASKSI